MFKFIRNLINLNALLAHKTRAIIAYNEGMVFYEAKDFRQALPLMAEASDLGNSQAMLILGTMYLLGEGVKEDGRLAVLWLQRAIDEGVDDAISVLGMAYATGKAGVQIDLPMARKMLTSCAENGDEQSARMLSMIENGEGMFKHLKKKVGKVR
jgi:TPR repeat protein